jgi:hypothetical protein
LRITPELLKPIVPALSLLLGSLRWLTQTIALEFEQLFRQSYADLVKERGTRHIPAADWWLYTEPRLMSTPSLPEIELQFKNKWADLLPLDDRQSLARFESSLLTERVERAFPELPVGYYPARYYCPDLMLATESTELIRLGQALYVLGELHSGKNTLAHAALVAQHPNPEELVNATKWDLSTGCFKILTTHEGEITTTRTSEGLFRPEDYLLATTPDAVAPKGLKSHPISELLICEQDGQLLAVTENGTRSFHILEAFSDLLFPFLMNKGSWVREFCHIPRVQIDQLVIQRESWRAAAEELEFAVEKDEAQRFMGARRWMKKRGIPQITFVRSPLEVKPFYLDLQSPVFVEILSKMVRRLRTSATAQKELVFSEMLPTTSQAWLQDASGAKYTSELRFALVDLKARALSQQFRSRQLKWAPCAIDLNVR